MASYGTKYRVRTRSRDGYVYRYDLRRRGYTGPAYNLFPGVEALEYELGRPGEQAFPILNASSVTCRVDVTRETPENVNLAELRRADATMWQGVLYREEGEELTELWQGYVVPDTFRDSPYEPVNAIEVAAFDGLGVLKNMRYGPSGDRTRLRDMILAGLSGLDARQSLYTLMRWYPWLPTAMTGDPLAELESDNDLWRDEAEDVFAHLHEVLAQAIGTFAMELFQGWDGWYAVQPYQLTRDVSLYGYNLTGASLSGVDASDLRVEGDYPVVRGMQRRLHRPTQHVSVTYDFEPELDQLLVNGGFEDDLEGWVELRSVDVVDSDEVFPDDATSEDQRAVKIAFDSQPEALQQVRNVRLAGGARQAFEIQFEAISDQRTIVGNSAIKVRIGDHYLSAGTADVASTTVLAGENTKVRLTDPLGVFLPGAHEDDVAIIPEGATLSFTVPRGGDPAILDAATLTLTRPARAGDTVLVGRVSNQVDDEGAGIELEVYGWGTQSDWHADFGLNADEPRTLRMPAFLRTPTGERVSGALEVTLIADEDPLGGGTPKSGYVAYNDIVCESTIDGEPITSETWQAAVQAPGAAVDVTPDFRLGDGPEEDSFSNLYDSSSGEATVQVDKTGWKVDDPYGASEETTGRTLPLVRARERLRLERGGLQWRIMTLLLRDGAKYAPENVLMYTLEDGSGTLPMWRSYLRWRIAAGEVDGEWHDLEKGPAGDIYEQITQAST